MLYYMFTWRCIPFISDSFTTTLREQGWCKV